MNRRIYDINTINSDDAYNMFIEYAFNKCSSFMFAYVNYYNKGYGKFQKELKEKLIPYKVKSRSNPSWPGTPYTHSINTTYSIIFYKTEPKAKEIIKSIKTNAFPFVCDMAFFIGDKCWFYSVTHESIAVLIDASNDDVQFLSKNLLIDEDKYLDYNDTSGYYDQFDEPGLGKLVYNT